MREGKLKGEMASSLYRVKSPDQMHVVDKRRNKVLSIFIMNIKTANKEINAMFRL